ncbi:MAG: PIN domain nuclease [Archaeoglobales archaeon]|nr:MAG: PIN domain nuclease [Archaeoglobales archaeon]
MKVIDASSLAKYILREDNWDKVRAYLLNEPYSLTLALAEVSSAIWKHCLLYKKASYEEAKTMFNALKKLGDVVIFEPFEKYLEDAMEISIEEGITVYDALYLAQAKVFGCLLTSDEKQWEIANKTGIQSEFIE